VVILHTVFKRSFEAMVQFIKTLLRKFSVVVPRKIETPGNLSIPSASILSVHGFPKISQRPVKIYALWKICHRIYSIVSRGL